MSIETETFAKLYDKLNQLVASGKISEEYAQSTYNCAIKEIRQVYSQQLSRRATEKKVNDIIRKYTYFPEGSVFARFAKSLFRGLWGLIIGLLVWVIMFWLIDFIVGLLGAIPILGSILYYPSDASWASIVLPPSTAVPAGAACSLFATGSAKTFSAAIILFYAFNLLLMVVLKTFSFSVLAVCIISIVAAVISFPMTRNDI